LTTQKAEANSQAAILSALDLATERMRRRLGESESSLQKFNVPLMQATTPSLTTLKAFTLGEEKRSQGLQAESIPSYKLAVDLDPQFALAYARLGNVYTNIGQASLSFCSACIGPGRRHFACSDRGQQGSLSSAIGYNSELCGACFCPCGNSIAEVRFQRSCSVVGGGTSI
jgi:hypothetical protein